MRNWSRDICSLTLITHSVSALKLLFPWFLKTHTETNLNIFFGWTRKTHLELLLDLAVTSIFGKVVTPLRISNHSMQWGATCLLFEPNDAFHLYAVKLWYQHPLLACLYSSSVYPSCLRRLLYKIYFNTRLIQDQGPWNFFIHTDVRHVLIIRSLNNVMSKITWWLSLFANLHQVNIPVRKLNMYSLSMSESVGIAPL